MFGHNSLGDMMEVFVPSEYKVTVPNPTQPGVWCVSVHIWLRAQLAMVF